MVLEEILFIYIIYIIFLFYITRLLAKLILKLQIVGRLEVGAIIYGMNGFDLYQKVSIDVLYAYVRSPLMWVKGTVEASTLILSKELYILPRTETEQRFSSYVCNAKKSFILLKTEKLLELVLFL